MIRQSKSLFRRVRIVMFSKLLATYIETYNISNPKELEELKQLVQELAREITRIRRK